MNFVWLLQLNRYVEAIILSPKYDATYSSRNDIFVRYVLCYWMICNIYYILIFQTSAIGSLYPSSIQRGK